MTPTGEAFSFPEGGDPECHEGHQEQDQAAQEERLDRVHRNHELEKAHGDGVQTSEKDTWKDKLHPGFLLTVKHAVCGLEEDPQRHQCDQALVAFWAHRKGQKGRCRLCCNVGSCVQQRPNSGEPESSERPPVRQREGRRVEPAQKSEGDNGGPLEDEWVQKNSSDWIKVYSYPNSE